MSQGGGRVFREPQVRKLIAPEESPHRAEMKGPLVAVLVVILLAGAGGAYLLLRSPSTPGGGSSSTGNQSSSSTSSQILVGPPAHVTVSNVVCTSNTGECVISLVNSGGTSIGATGCTMNGSSGDFAPKPSSVPPGGLVNVSCTASTGNGVSIPGFHVGGSILFSDGSSVQYVGSWK